MKEPDKFIIIDDDFVNNSILSISIRRALGRDNVEAFNSAREGIRYIENECKTAQKNLRIVLFLDINLPVISGWDALAKLEVLDENIKKHLTVFMLSCSIDPKDKKRAMEHSLVCDFLEKPLSIDKIEALFK